jgi:BMFP domain-containing protein YqiC
MSNPQLIEEISAKFSALLAASPARDIEKNLRAFLSGGAAQFDLVSREEFDIQRELLTRTRDRVAALEKRVEELEARLGDRPA